MHSVLRVLTLVFWVATPIWVVLLVASTFTQSPGAWLQWTIAISLLLVVLSSGGITWAEFGKTPLADTERGEWTNTMLFYAIVFALSLIFAFLYLPSLYF
jgi:hypothetical protein